jgi:hypothetical protein
MRKKRGPGGIIIVLVGFAGALAEVLWLGLNRDFADLGPYLVGFGGIVAFGLLLLYVETRR